MMGVGRMLLWGVVGAAVGAFVGGRRGAGPGVAIGAAAAALTRPRGGEASLGNVFTTAWNYWFPSAKAAEAPATPQKPATGLYGEGGYIYHYDRNGSAITIVSSPRGSKQVSVARGTDAHKAIYRQIVTGAAKPMDPATVKATRKARAPAPPSSASSPSSAPAAYAPEPGSEATGGAPAPWYQPEGAPSWLIPAGLGLGAVLLLGAAAFALRR